MSALNLLTVFMSVCIPSAAGPTLVFSKDDLPTLRERVESGQQAQVWTAILARAEAYCTPASAEFVDPSVVAKEPAGNVRVTVLGHHFGRRLTNWMETIGFAYQLTGEPRFAEHGVLLLNTAVQGLPVSDPRIAKGFAGARGDIMRGLAMGYDWLGEAMTEEQRYAWAEAAAAYVRNILAEAQKEGTWWVPYHNFMGVAVGAAGCLALKLRPFYPDQADAWVKDCASLVRTWLDEGFDDQGAYFEGTLYSIYGLTNAVLFADALVRDGGPNLFEHPHLMKVPHFLAMSVLPGEGVLEARNDANYGGIRHPSILRIAAVQQNGLAMWLWERCGGGQSPLQIVWANDVTPTAPTTNAEHFEGRGLCVFRTGWDEDDIMFSIEAGPYYAITHNQADKGHFTLYGLGRRWAIDSGYGNTQKPGGKDQTLAHNCVLIDGEGQALSGASLGTNGEILAYECNADYGYALADATEAYNRNNRGTPGAGVRYARRHAIFMWPSHGAPAYAVVLDDIQKDDAEHDYTWLMHTWPNVDITLDPAGAVLRPNGASGEAFVETPAAASGQGTCAWRFDIEKQGTYTIWARVRAPGEELGKSDSFFVQVDAGEDIAWHMPRRADWTWAKVTKGIEGEPVSIDLDPGEHVLRFKTREPAAQVDRLVVTADANVEPPFLGEPQGILLEAEDGEVTAPMRVVRVPGDPAAPSMKVLMHAPTPVSFRVDAYDGHPRLNATTRAVKPEFIALLLPLPADVAGPEVTSRSDGTERRILVRWPSRTDAIVWPLEGDRRPKISISSG